MKERMICTMSLPILVHATLTQYFSSEGLLLSRKNLIYFFYLDFSKSLETILCGELFVKLENIGISTNIVNWRRNKLGMR